MPSHGSLLAFETSLKQFICIFTAFLILTCAADPAPLGVPVGTDFYGYDGLWSRVNIRVGGPSAQAQWVTVFPFTGSQETWVIGPGGCDGTYTCEQARGGLFVKNQSDTWKEEGY